MSALTLPLRRTFVGAAFALTCASITLAHIRIAPTESVPGAREKYTMRVPNEKKVNSTKVVGEFRGLDIYDFESAAGISNSRRTTRAKSSEPRGPAPCIPTNSSSWVCWASIPRKKRPWSGALFSITKTVRPKNSLVRSGHVCPRLSPRSRNLNRQLLLRSKFVRVYSKI